MGILSPPGPKRISIPDIQKVISWVLWTPYFISMLAVLLFVLARVVLYYLPGYNVQLRRWYRIRDWLAVKTSAGEFSDVYSQHSVEQVTPRNFVQGEESNLVSEATNINVETQHSNPRENAVSVTREKDLLVAERRIPATAKGSWYNMYLLLLPLQVALITIVIVHHIYSEEYRVESCSSFAQIANSFNESRFYDCRYHEVSRPNDEIFKTCNTTDNGNDEINCSVYYYNPLLSRIIVTILNSLLLHATLAKGIIRFIIFARYIAHKYDKIGPQKCPGKKPGAFVVMIIFAIISGIALLLYAFGSQ